MSLYLDSYVGCGNERFGGCGGVMNAHEGISPQLLKKPEITMEHGYPVITKEQTIVPQNTMEHIAMESSSKDNTLGSKKGKPLFTYVQGILESQAIDVLQRFYLRGNPKAPDHKRERPLMHSHMEE